MKKFLIAVGIILIGALSGFSQRVRLVHPYERQGNPTIGGAINIYNLPSAEGADLIVYRTTDMAEAVGSECNGIWYFVDKNFTTVRADFAVIVTDSPNKADVLVYFTDNKEEAGFKNLKKREFFK